MELMAAISFKIAKRAVCVSQDWMGPCFWSGLFVQDPLDILEFYGFRVPNSTPHQELDMVFAGCSFAGKVWGWAGNEGLAATP
jgi:hypothetical protein